MKAYLCVDPAGRILETGAIAAALWEQTGPQHPHCARYEIGHETKLVIEGDGHERFFATREEDEPGEEIGRDLTGALKIKRKQAVVLTVSKAIFQCGEQIEVRHSGTQPVKVWAARRPLAGAHHGKIHAGGAAKLGAELPGYYEVRVRDPRHWAEPIMVRATSTEKADGR